MQHRWWKISIVFAMVAATVVVTDSAMAHPAPDPGPAIAPPAALSTSGDYATDVLGDPWDFSNDEDVPPIELVGSENSFGITRDAANGLLNIDGGNGSTVKLVHTWGLELPWGRDGLQKPIDAAVYSQVTVRIFIPGTQNRDIGVRYVTESGGTNVNFQKNLAAGWEVVNIDLTKPGEFGASVWSGKVVRLEIAIGGVYNGGTDRGLFQVDWASLHRPDVHPTTAPGVAPQPVVKVLSPSEEGGADYATVSGNAWDFTGPEDVLSSGDLTINSFANGNLNGTTIRNDSFVEVPLPNPLNPDRYHRATVDVCYDGGFALTNAAGGGMNARFAWFDEGGQTWSETQDILIYPGCNRMTIDLATTPAVAVNDEGTVYKAGWRGLRITRLRFDLNEDPGVRGFNLNEIRLADDAAFSPPATYPITFSSTTAGTAVLYATTSTGTFDTTHQIGTVPVVANVVKTLDWDGSGLPNGTYSVWVKVTNNGVIGSAYSTGPVRIEKPVLATPSCYVPLNPARVLDTRDGTGGNISALTSQAMTEMKVTGVGGVPPTGATAVVLNVTVDAPISSGFITAWPSGEGQPTVSNLNYVAGQTVPNLVTVKLGANGRVNLYNSEGFTHLVADVVGYYTAASQGCTGLFTAVTPGRVLDTRNGTGTAAGSTAPVGAGQSINVTVTGGAFGVPATGVSGVALNVTVDQPTSAGYLTVWPTGDVQPLASSHNFVAGLTVANLVLAKVGTGGQVSIFNSAGSTHVVADVVGYFSARGGTFVPVSPVRIVDSRFGVGQGVNGPLGQQVTHDVNVTGGVSPVPANATAAIVNVTSVNSSLPSFITVWPKGDPKPTASTVNPRPGVPVPNLAYLKLGTGGQLSIFNNTGSTDYLVDVFGYVIP